MLDLKDFLDSKVEEYNVPDFIEDDPIGIPHRYSLKQDVEIAAFFAAMLAWGQRVTIINKVTELLSLMGDAPYEFIVNHTEADRSIFESFKHRTFQYTDTLYFVDFLQRHYRQYDSLEDAFIASDLGSTTKERLEHFHNYFFDAPYAPQRTRKHISTPVRKSACKRLNMYLRWMVRPADTGVDLGLWSRISTADLMIPLDVHVAKVAHHYGLLTRKQRDWKAVEELTGVLTQMDPSDPVKYDFALFGMGVSQEI